MEDFDGRYTEALIEGHYQLQETAYNDCLIYYDRKPTEEELEEMIECLRDKYC